MVSLLLWLACSSPAPEQVEALAPPSAPAPEALAPPAGSIGGAPILPDPVVLGAISAEAVAQGIAAQMEAINLCYEEARAKNAALAGKVLVRFSIAPDGSVSRTSISSTSLWDAPTEECVSARVAQASFPALEGGRVAIVTYPFVFPAG
jgi:hypothetical protein